ncbi:trace amine-associated receptor 13c-like [Alosa sapidissima]|uniref:trace amine-associated receptor 13c-like n=1 Tax=Alosa sapidissima TaxID=34773 RepID=UPI001C08331C|nr:trace amine-associated receptor 13c-like [Alosa sapidissima]
MEDPWRANRCYPALNSSCTKFARPKALHIIMYIFLSSISVSTVLLNLLVIISIFHFKQLHTPTNLLILSLAVADLFIGLTVMPVEGSQLIETCWYFGDTLCNIFPFIYSVALSGSLCSLVLISIDRFIAVSDPLRYSLKVTHNKVVIIVVLGWCICLLYMFFLLYDHLTEMEPHRTCHGECLFTTISFSWIVGDVFVSFIVPCSMVIILNMKIFCTAKYHTKVINSVTERERAGNKDTMRSKKSSRKAEKTIGVLVTVYLLCYMPYNLSIFAYGPDSLSYLFKCLVWIVYLNSCMNPIIYALFYPWFKVSTKYIITLAILHPGSSYFNVNSDVK